MEAEKEISFEAFFAAYTIASGERKQVALRAAVAALNAGCNSNSELMTARALAKALKIHEATVWRWKFPFEEWAGQKRYNLETSKAYLKSPSLKLRLTELREERRRASSKICKSGKRGVTPVSVNGSEKSN